MDEKRCEIIQAQVVELNKRLSEVMSESMNDNPNITNGKDYYQVVTTALCSLMAKHSAIMTKFNMTDLEAELDRTKKWLGKYFDLFLREEREREEKEKNKSSIIV